MCTQMELAGATISNDLFAQKSILEAAPVTGEPKMDEGLVNSSPKQMGACGGRKESRCF